MPRPVRAARGRRTPKPKWKRRPEARTEEILSAALEVFGEVGFARAKLDDVARRAGVSKGTVYLYFDSKDELFRRLVLERIIPCFQEAEEHVRESQDSARELLEWYIRSKWDVIRQPEMVQIARLVHAELASFPELARFYFEEVVLRSRTLLNQILERGVAAGEFRAVSHNFVLRAVPSQLVHGAIYQRGFGTYDPHALTDAELLEGILDLVLHGVLSRKG